VSTERLSRITQWLDSCGVVLRVAAPVVDLPVRLSLAKAFFAPGMLPSNPWAWSYFTFKVGVRLITGVGADFDTTAT